MTKPDFTFDVLESSDAYYNFIIQYPNVSCDSFKRAFAHSYWQSGARYQHKLDLEKHEAVVAELQNKISAMNQANWNMNERLEKSSAEIATLKEQLDYINTDAHSCSNKCSRLHCVQRREIDALKEVNKELIEAIERVTATGAGGCVYVDRQKILKDVLAGVKEKMK